MRIFTAKIFFLKRRKFIFSLLLFAVVVPIFYFSLYGHNDELDFNTEIRPIINGKCISCHGGVKRAGGFSLLFRSEALAKNESGKPAIIPGNPDESEFIKRLVHHDSKKRMPLNGPRLSDQEINKLKKWIEQGAKWADHWAYVKPKAVEVPSVGSDWATNNIDKFVYTKLEEQGLKPGPEADRATLLRRVSLDLTGLPPSLQELENFKKDQSVTAYEKVVDRLLASPRYGERWAAMWMDLARYADSKGYEKDPHREIWKYRDWVIQAFNEDKPFDEFTIEQLAGDLLPSPTQNQIIATAFHRNTMNNSEGGTDNEEFRTSAVIDRVNTTWEVWQSTTIGCVQCHSHPYDPFKNKEYYQFLSFFNNTEDADDDDERPLHSVFEESTIPEQKELLSWIRCYNNSPDNIKYQLLPSAKRKKLYPLLLGAGKADILKNVKTKPGDVLGYIQNRSFIAFKNIDLTDINKVSYGYASAGGGIIEMRIDSINGTIVSIASLYSTGAWDKWEVANALLREVKGKHDIYFQFDAYPSSNTLFDLNWINFHKKSVISPVETREDLRRERDVLGSIFASTSVPIMRDLPKEKSRKTNIFIRGNWMAKGEEVNSGVPGSMNSMPKGAPLNRLGMAQWLVSSDNPLTSRVIVNRFWAQLFGTGIVESIEDFGTQGAKPSHPELLDWLALDFIHTQKWSVKKMLKQIVMSSTYRQSSKFSPENLEKDPGNKYLSRGPRFRLSAEHIRDQALSVAGILSSKMFGPSVMPAQPANIWMNPHTEGGKTWILSDGEDKYRRGLYTYYHRTSPYPSMLTFDAPSREFCLSRRIRTNTPLQSLVTLNDTVYFDAARKFAQRILKTKPTSKIKDQIELAYRMAIITDANPQSIDKLVKLYENLKIYYTTHLKEANEISLKDSPDNPEFASMVVIANTILNLDEFMMKQ